MGKFFVRTYLMDNHELLRQMKMIVKGDKSSNLHLVEKYDYFKQCRDFISSKYKIVNDDG